MITERMAASSPDGRHVAIWRSRPDVSVPAGQVVVIGTGMGGRMRNTGVIAQYLAANGATVYRYDVLDHVGQSDGDIDRFTVRAAVESLAATLETALRTEQVDRVTLLPVSIAAVAAYRLAPREPRVNRMVCMSGVVDLRETMARSLGADYPAWRLEDLPERVRFEGYEIDPRHMWFESHATDWYGIDGTAAALARFPGPVVNVVGLEDEWVTVDEVRRAYDGMGHAPRLIVQLPHVAHTVSRNLVAMRAVLEELTRLALDLSDDAEVAAPTFEEILDVRTQERRREREEASSVPAG